MYAYDPAEWSELFVASAGAAAALAGLVFVAVSINVERILKFQGLPERALATLLLLLAVVVVSLLGLAPGQSPVALGVEFAGFGVLAAIATMRLVMRPQEGANRSSARGSVAIMATGTVPYAVAGVSLAAGAGGGLYWVLAGMILALVGAVLNAWVFLVEILR